MIEIKDDDCCDLGVKGPCVACDFSIFCKGKWSHETGRN